MDIYIREKNGAREIRIPILPERIMFKRGETSFISYDIMNLGKVVVPSGTGPTGLSWESNFPGANSPEVPSVRGYWKAPDAYDTILEDWKAKRTKLNILITGYRSFNQDVYIENYEGELSGAFGDIFYQLEFVEAREIVVKTSKVEPTKTPTETTQRPVTTGRTHKIVEDDTLWSLARKFYLDGNKWTVIYEANKEIIEQTAKKHGHDSSENGYWLFPGIVLEIPELKN